MAITQVINLMSNTPSISDPVNFEADAEAFLVTDMVTRANEMNTWAAQANILHEAINVQADNVNALAAAMSLNSTNDTSTTSNSIALGFKTFAISPSKSYVKGMYVVIADTAAPSVNSMFGIVDSYSGTTLVVNAISILGSGTKTAWTISQSAKPFDLATLAADTGATLIGFKQSGTGAVSRTVNSLLQESESALNFGLVGDGVTNNSPLLTAARTAAAGRKIVLPKGTFKFDSALASGEDLVIEGQGDDTILDFTGATGTYALDAVGTTTALPDLVIDAVAGAMSIQLATAPTLVAGDVFAIYNPTASSWSNFRTEYRAGEWCEVLSVAGTTVNLKTPLYEGYVVADVDLYKMNSPKVSLKNFAIKGTTIAGLIRAALCNNPIIENIKGDNANNSVIYMDRCFKYQIINPRATNIGDGGDDYGISIGNSQHGRTLGGSAYARRHGITHGGSSDICSVPYRDCLTIGTHISNDFASSTESADFHGNGEFNYYIDCVIRGGANFQGKDNFYKGCTIYARTAGVVIFHAEIKGGTFGAIDCKFITTENPFPSGRGIYDIGGNNLTTVTADTVLPCIFRVKNCTLNGTNLSASTTFMNFKNRGSTQKMSFEIDGLQANVNAMSAMLRTEVVSGTADSDFIVVDNVGNFPSATSLHTATGSAYATFPHRLQKQTGSVTLSAATGTASTVAAPINFKYTYLRAPSAQATAVGALNGNRTAIASLHTLTGTQIRPRIDTGDAATWTATADRVVNWTACIDEV